ncbi:hypothetical protein HRbin26_01105 [bacterium HR26]|nr:hypothetical protein HRbin26_01105 [bacterium HR26]
MPGGAPFWTTAGALGHAVSGRLRGSGAMRRPNLSVQVSVAPALPSSCTVKMNAPPSVWLPPRAFQYRSALGQTRGSSCAMLSSAASIACFSEAAKPIESSPCWRAKTCGRSIEVSVIPISRQARLAGTDWAIRKNHGPSGEPCMWTVWSIP